jgi:hypothetical protein
MFPLPLSLSRVWGVSVRLFFPHKATIRQELTEPRPGVIVKDAKGRLFFVHESGALVSVRCATGCHATVHNSAIGSIVSGAIDSPVSEIEFDFGDPVGYQQVAFVA